jgi:glycosyltransferase involved in cell wall biosynthesis
MNRTSRGLSGLEIMHRVLLYSPDVIGHPRVYCRVIADALEGEPCELVVAMGFTDEVGLKDSPDLQPLASRQGLRLVDTRTFSESGTPHLTAEELVKLQVHFGIDTTLFIEADKSNAQFARIALGQAPRLRGRNLGIFANTAEWYPGEDSFTGEPRGLIGATVRTTLGNIKRALFDRKKSVPYFYEHILIGNKVLDEILVKDERLAAWRGTPVVWMPEISRPAAAPETPEETAEYEQRRQQLQAFLEANPGREPVLYFGDAAYYKGYDLFLEFVATTPSVCAIHAGRACDALQRSYLKRDVDSLRAQLTREGRLYETNSYVHGQRVKELFFGSVRVYLTTHRLALSSSTVVQALELGKPVLVPDRGLLGHRVRSNDLGGVYRYEDVGDLRRNAEALWRGDLSRFAKTTKSFWARFSDEAIRAFFLDKLRA